MSMRTVLPAWARMDPDVVHASRSAQREGAGLVDAVVADAVVRAGAGPSGCGLGQHAVGDRWRGAQRSLGARL